MTDVTIGGRTYQVEIRGDVVVINGEEYPVEVKDAGPYLTVTAAGVPYRVQLPPEAERSSGMEIQVDYRPFTVEYSEQMGSGPPPRAAAPRQRGGGGGDPVSSVPGGVAAPIAGRVITVMAKQGDTVASGDVLLLLEAMKMENEVKAPMDGTIKEVMVTDGQRVSEGETLIVIE